MGWPKTVLMVRPDHFRVEYAINPFMTGKDPVDTKRAVKQWESYKAALENEGLEVFTMPAHENFPDLVFCANQAFPFHRNGRKVLLPAKMKSSQRAGEVPLIVDFLKKMTDEILPASNTEFEACGDAIWNYETGELFVGYGHRTEKATLAKLESEIGAKVFGLSLVSSMFYHLDTCFAVLDRDHCLYVEEAFDRAGLELIRSKFSGAIRISLDEATKFMSGNAVALEGKRVLLQTGASETVRTLRAKGFKVIELDADEFIKSGGSLFCMKQFLWD
jgi:N-dimethylarginine dimethylaminohydrolase